MNWRKAQWQDPFYKAAQGSHYRARSAFKLLEINDKFNIFRARSTVIDLGCAPGSWMQVAAEKGASFIAGIDIQKMQPIKNTHFGHLDFLDTDAINKFLLEINSPSKFDLVLSDIAPNISGIRDHDQARSIELVRQVLVFATDRLSKDGFLVIKTFEGSGMDSLLKKMAKVSVKFFKPKASRSDSREIYLIIQGQLDQFLFP